MNWFKCSIRYEKTVENGMLKKVTEPYLVDAISHAEAENRIIKEITPFISGEFTVSKVTRENISEMFEDETGDKWYKAKVMFVTVDEKHACEKKIASNMYVQAIDFKAALSNLEEGMKGTMADYTIAQITETAIMDIFPYTTESETKIEEVK